MLRELSKVLDLDDRRAAARWGNRASWSCMRSAGAKSIERRPAVGHVGRRREHHRRDRQLKHASSLQDQCALRTLHDQALARARQPQRWVRRPPQGDGGGGRRRGIGQALEPPAGSLQPSKAQNIHKWSEECMGRARLGWVDAIVGAVTDGRTLHHAVDGLLSGVRES